MKSILDPSFRYTASFDTDLRKTFARIRRHPRDAAEHRAAAAEGTRVDVASMVGRSAKVRS
jgi:hypothetical protein